MSPNLGSYIGGLALTQYLLTESCTPKCLVIARERISIKTARGAGHSQRGVERERGENILYSRENAFRYPSMNQSGLFLTASLIRLVSRPYTSTTSASIKTCSSRVVMILSSIYPSLTISILFGNM